MFTKGNLCVLCCIALLALVHCQKYEGDLCTHTESNQSGQCVLLEKCPSAIEDLTQRRKFPQTCGFAGTQPIVCCPQPSGGLTTTTVRTTSTTTSTTTKKANKPDVQQRAGEKSEQKCKEYGKFVYKKEKPPILVIGAPDIEVNQCAIVEVPLIVGGEAAKPKEFPHMALLGYGPENSIEWLCGGTLISELFVLTAGHCLYHRTLGEIRHIRLGDLNIYSNSDDAEPEHHTVQQIIAHPDYKPPSQYNDIALLKMDRPATFSAYIRPACLHKDFEIPTEKAIATGWGKTQFAGEGSDDMLKVTLELFSVKRCNDSYRNQIGRRLPNGIKDDVQVCAGSNTQEKDTCQGDSGGPLQIYSKSVYCMYDVIGVTSFGKGCGTVGIPGVYTRISPYLKWIENIVWP